MATENKKGVHAEKPIKTNHHAAGRDAGVETENTRKYSGQNVAGNRLDQPGALTEGPEGRKPTSEPDKPKQSRREA